MSNIQFSFPNIQKNIKNIKLRLIYIKKRKKIFKRIFFLLILQNF